MTEPLAAWSADEAEDEVPAPLVPRAVVVADHQHGERLDRVLAAALPAVSRSRIQQWIAAGAVLVNGAASRSRDAVAEADRIEVTPPPDPERAAFGPEPMALDIVFEDESILVLNKPAGLVVHPARGHWSGTLLNGLLAHDAALARLPRAGIVHRLDADTSGLMVVARSAGAYTDLVAQLQARSVTREYWAVAFGAGARSGTIDAPLARDPRNPLRFHVARTPAAKLARTHYRCLGEADADGVAVAWIACRLETGRTHQIRVHLESIGHPLVGDAVYRRGRPALRAADARQGILAEFPRQALHACALRLVHPATRAECSWFQPPPADLRTLMQGLGWRRVDRPVAAF